MALSAQQVISVLCANRLRLTAMGARHITLFGSLARGEAGPESDIDLALTLDRPMPASRFIPLCETIESLLGRHTDIIDDCDLPQTFSARLEAEGIRAY